jgi:hypothetical protein
MLLGLLASGMAGIVVIFKTFGHRIMSVLTFWKKDDRPEDTRAGLRPTDDGPTPVPDEDVDQATPSAS